MDRNQLLNDPETAIRYALDGRQSQIWTTLPGIVDTVDLSAMTCSVQPAIQGVQTNPDGSETFINLPLLVDVPICFPSAGGFTLTLPVKSGDEVLVHIASRCIDSWWQSGGVGVPMESRMHDLSDGFAVPGVKSQPNVISGISATNAQLRTDDGTAYLEITPTGRVNITAPAGMTFTTPTLTVTGEVIAGIIPLSTHIHTGVVSGTSDTGGPIP